MRAKVVRKGMSELVRDETTKINPLKQSKCHSNFSVCPGVTAEAPVNDLPIRAWLLWVRLCCISLTPIMKEGTLERE